MSTPLKIIHVEDSQPDSELIVAMLANAGWQCDLQRIETKPELLQALKSDEFDLILSDCSLPQFHGLEALRVAHAHRPELPFIFVSGTIGEEVAIKSLHEGATDYVLKSRLSRLVPAVQRALDEAENRKQRFKVEAQLRQSRKLETLGTLASGLAHDFRNLLQILKLNVSLLPMEANNPAAIMDLAGKLDRATDRASDYMQELLVFARKTDAHLASVDLAQAAWASIEMIKGSLPGNVTISVKMADGLPPIMADVGQIDRILTNLIINARDALPDGGVITISIDLVRFEKPSANIWKVQDGPYLRLRVGDNGVGMNEETRAQIFDPFFTTKPQGKGTGLGLSVVFGLLESHRGLIDVDSAPGMGTVFSLFFPACIENCGQENGAEIVSCQGLISPATGAEPPSA